MKKILTVFSFIIMLCACAFGSIFGFAESEAAQNGDQLFLPKSYEQYLELVNPTDFAISKEYVAIADKKDTSTTVLYLFNKSENKYKSCTVSTSNTVSSLNFYTSENKDYLFFLETGNKVKYIDCEQFTQPNEFNEMQASSLIFNGNNVYYTVQTGSTSNLHHAIIDNFVISDDAALGLPFNTDIKPSFSKFGETIYFSADKAVYICTPTQYASHIETSDSINYFAVYGESTSDIIYTNTGGLVYINNSNQSSIQNVSASVVKYFEGHAFFLVPEGILQYDIENQTFTDYQIGKYSKSENRLNAPVDISSYGDKIIIADNGNERLSVYENGQYSSFETQITPTQICAGANNLLVINSAEVYLYDYSGNEKANFNLTANVVSATYSVGEFYIITTGGTTAKISAEDFSMSDEYSAQLGGAKSITSDLYGNIYLLNSSGQVYSYTVEEFLSDDASGEQVTSFSVDCTKLLVDYDCNLYSVSTDKIYCFNGEIVNEVSVNLSDFVFSQNKTIISFALNLYDENLYILSDGFIVKKDIGISTFKNIKADGLYSSLYENSPTSDNLIVDVKKGSIVVNLDIKKVDSTTATLPYISYSKLENDVTATVLSKIDAGYIVALYQYVPAQNSSQLPKHEYHVFLVCANNVVEPIINNQYYQEEQGVGYLSSAVNLYRRPLMSDFSKIQKVERNSKVTIKGKISLSEYTLDSDYFFIEINGELGFIPASFITENAPVKLDEQNFKYQNLKKGESATLTADNGDSITLSNKEQLKVYSITASQEGFKVVSYQKDGVEYFGEIKSTSLNSATSTVIVTLVIIMLVATSVILSTCYLILRKKPTLE